MSIAGATATPIAADSHVFYETEITAVIHRYKTKSSGLVGTTVWAWRGSKVQAREQEEKKLQELARRYNTSLVKYARLPSESIPDSVFR
jgi:hypothetical protein